MALQAFAEEDVRRLDAIGRGSTSVVYRALRASTGTLVAVKVGDAVANEIAVLRRILSSSSTSTNRGLLWYAFFDDSDSEEDSDDSKKTTTQATRQLACEWCPVGSAEACLGHVRFPVPWLADIAENVFAALEVIHAAGVLHRDVKPGNVLLTRDGAARLADFGLACEGPETAAFVGTFQFLAPERLRGQTYGAAADVWSAALTLLVLHLEGVPASLFRVDEDFWPAMEFYEDPRLYDNALAEHRRTQSRDDDDEEDDDVLEEAKDSESSLSLFRGFVEARLAPDPAKRPRDWRTDPWLVETKRWTLADRRLHLAPLAPAMASRLADLRGVLDLLRDDDVVLSDFGAQQLRNLADSFDLPESTVKTALAADDSPIRLAASSSSLCCVCGPRRRRF